MNCYGLPKNERDYYRLAHVHRVVLNRVPYHQNGEVDDGCVLVWNGQSLDWTAWDKRFGPLFRRLCFRGFAAKGRADGVFLPSLERELADADGGQLQRRLLGRPRFPASYRQNFVEASRQFAEHLRTKAGTTRFFSAFLTTN